MVCENLSWYSWFAPRIIPYLTQKALILYLELPKYAKYADFDTRGGGGGWGVSYMDQRGRGSCGMGELVLGHMGCSTDHTISHV